MFTTSANSILSMSSSSESERTKPPYDDVILPVTPGIPLPGTRLPPLVSLSLPSSCIESLLICWTRLSEATVGYKRVRSGTLNFYSDKHEQGYERPGLPFQAPESSSQHGSPLALNVIPCCFWKLFFVENVTRSLCKQVP